jgi:hypothetical protein
MSVPIVDNEQRSDRRLAAGHPGRQGGHRSRPYSRVGMVVDHANHRGGLSAKRRPL